MDVKLKKQDIFKSIVNILQRYKPVEIDADRLRIIKFGSFRNYDYEGIISISHSDDGYHLTVDRYKSNNKTMRFKSKSGDFDLKKITDRIIELEKEDTTEIRIRDEKFSSIKANAEIIESVLDNKVKSSQSRNNIYEGYREWNKTDEWPVSPANLKFPALIYHNEEDHFKIELYLDTKEQLEKFFQAMDVVLSLSPSKEVKKSAFEEFFGSSETETSESNIVPIFSGKKENS